MENLRNVIENFGSLFLEKFREEYSTYCWGVCIYNEACCLRLFTAVVVLHINNGKEENWVMLSESSDSDKAENLCKLALFYNSGYKLKMEFTSEINVDGCRCISCTCVIYYVNLFSVL